MSYATIADLEQRVGAERLTELTDFAGNNTRDVTAINRALTDAAAEIDAYIGARFRLPLAQVPLVLVRVACDIAVYRLTALRRVGDVEEARARYEDAVRFLQALASGQATLGTAFSERPPLARPAARSGPPPVFGRAATAGF